MKEHFCTLFDSNFFPYGMSLHESLKKHCADFHLWVLCMDDELFKYFKTHPISTITPIKLSDIESPDLLKVKPTRKRGEYCWTLTPFLPSWVLDRHAEVSRVTYVDADLFFFDSPASLFQELAKVQKSVLITEHGYAPEYDQSELSGRFCVQFVTFANNEKAKAILKWWQDRCIEWCHDYHEDGKFGDQKYLDVWPSLFKDDVHIFSKPERTLAPWNIRWFLAKDPSTMPVFFHFHGLRVSGRRIRLFFSYRVGSGALDFYRQYIEIFRKFFGIAERDLKIDSTTKKLPAFEQIVELIRELKLKSLGRIKFVDLQ